MKYIVSIVIIGLIGAFFLVETPSSEKHAYDLEKIPVKGMVTMLDLGAKSCIPCKMMAPILEKLEKDYRGKAAIVFIDIRENREQATLYKIKAMPTQIFFDPEGKEVYRHIGFMDEEQITAQLKRMGVN